MVVLACGFLIIHLYQASLPFQSTCVRTMITNHMIGQQDIPGEPLVLHRFLARGAAGGNPKGCEVGEKGKCPGGGYPHGP